MQQGNHPAPDQLELSRGARELSLRETDYGSICSIPSDLYLMPGKDHGTRAKHDFGETPTLELVQSLGTLSERLKRLAIYEIESRIPLPDNAEKFDLDYWRPVLKVMLALSEYGETEAIRIQAVQCAANILDQVEDVLREKAVDSHLAHLPGCLEPR